MPQGRCRGRQPAPRRRRHGQRDAGGGQLHRGSWREPRQVSDGSAPAKRVCAVGELTASHDLLPFWQRVHRKERPGRTEQGSLTALAPLWFDHSARRHRRHQTFLALGPIFGFFEEEGAGGETSRRGRFPPPPPPREPEAVEPAVRSTVADTSITLAQAHRRRCDSSLSP